MGKVALSKSQKLLVKLLRDVPTCRTKLKLAKLQYMVDFIHYAFNHQPVSGEHTLYERRPYGPLSRTFNIDIAQLSKLHLVEVKNNSLLALTPQGEASAPSFTPEELKTIDYVVSRYGRLSPNELISISHDQEPYLSTREGNVIEYFTAYNLIDDHSDYKGEECDDLELEIVECEQAEDYANA